MSQHIRPSVHNSLLARGLSCVGHTSAHLPVFSRYALLCRTAQPGGGRNEVGFRIYEAHNQVHVFGLQPLVCTHHTLATKSEVSEPPGQLYHSPLSCIHLHTRKHHSRQGGVAQPEYYRRLKLAGKKAVCVLTGHTPPLARMHKTTTQCVMKHTS